MFAGWFSADSIFVPGHTIVFHNKVITRKYFFSEISKVIFQNKSGNKKSVVLPQQSSKNVVTMSKQ